jgi:hypothetical protein
VEPPWVCQVPAQALDPAARAPALVASAWGLRNRGD